MAGPHGPKKRTLRPGKRPRQPAKVRAEIRKSVISKSRIPEIPEIESLPESAAPVEIVVDSAPVPKAGGPGTGALPRSKKPTPAHVKAALARAEATSAGKEAPKVDETGVDPALKAEFGEGAEEAKAETAAKAAEALADLPARMGGADVYVIKSFPEEVYTEEAPDQAREACLNGATDHDLADIFRVSLRTIFRWKAKHVSFRQAIHLGTKEFRENQNDNVERGLYQRATGYIQRTEKVMQFKGQVMRVQQDEHVPADVGAAKHWLANRRPDEWKVDPETGNVPGAAEALVGMQVMELARRMGMLLLTGAQAEEAIELEAETVVVDGHP